MTKVPRIDKGKKVSSINDAGKIEQPLEKNKTGLLPYTTYKKLTQSGLKTESEA